MKNNIKLIIFFISLILIPTIAVGLVPEDITIWSDPAWATAGGKGIMIYVKVENATLGGALSNANVRAVVEGTDMGKIQPASQKTKDGIISVPFTFTPSIHSGMAVIQFSVVYTSGKTSYLTEQLYFQPIDHATPYSIAYLGKTDSVPAGTITDLVVQYRDYYGNPIDNRYEEASSPKPIPEEVVFSDAIDGDGGFWDGCGNVNSIAVSVNDTGYAAVKYKVATISGDNVISIRGPPKVSPSITFVTIKGIGSAPYAIRSDITPLTRTAYANNEDTFSLLYTILDSYGNPVPGIAFWRNTSLGEHERFVTNNEGKALTLYGPKKSIGNVDITAVVEGNPQISVTDTVQFVQTEAVMWELTASPQILASREINPSIMAEIRAKVMDELGNPIEGELVTFSLVQYSNSTPLTVLPSLVTTTALTDKNGYALVGFLPGAFPVEGDAAFDENATGTALVGASWKGRSKTIPISYRNYPYLRVETEIFPMTIGINETMDVTVRLIGDGYTLISKPVDVVMVIDRSGSMERNQVDDGTGKYITRMVAAKQAAGTFLSEMKEGKDRVGLVSYSYEYDVKIDSPLGTDFTAIKTKIDALTGSGGTAMREGFRNSIEHLISNPKPKAIRAVILMTDGNWNNGGSPLATGKGYRSNFTARDLGITSSSRYNGFSSLAKHFEDEDYRWYEGLGGTLRGPSNGTSVVYTPAEYDETTGALIRQRTYQVQNNVVYCSDGQFTNQNMSIYAKNNGIILYTISFAQNVPQRERESLEILARSTGGFYRHAPTVEELSKIYREIARELQSSAAAVDTEMVLDFEMLNVTYDNTTTLMPGKDVFTYQFLNGTSTNISSWNTTTNPLPGHVPSYPYTVDQTGDWEQDPTQLTFSIGNISINQTWQATFRFKAKVPGNIDIFGSNSVVQFGGENNKYLVPIPSSYATVIGDIRAEDNHTYLLSLEGLPSPEEVCMGSKELEYQWTLNYSGNRSVTQEVYYQTSENGQVWTGNWIYFTTVDAGTGPIDNKIIRVGLDTQDRFGYFNIKVIASEDLIGGLQDEWVGSPKLIKTCGCIQIT